MIQLRDYQGALRDRILTAWGLGARNVMATLATGGGKTVIFSDILRTEPAESVAIAHRQELLGQISMALAANDVPHKILAPKNVIGWIVANHVKETGRSRYNGQARCTVAGVDTLLARAETLGQWGARQRLWVIDEGHHILKGNKWGKVLGLFPNARGLAVTATPGRADGNGLGRHADGIIDALLEGAGMRDLMARGYLCPYRIFAPPSDLDLSTVKVSDSTGDYVPEQLRLAAHKSHIVGDVVAHYNRLTPGRLGVTFATDIETARDLTDQYRASGVPAELITAKTPGQVRVELLRKFRRREVLQIVNVDLFGEGFDLPALEVVSMARPTQSFGLYAQQFGRVVRPLEGKAHGIILDHVGNVARHGLPDQPRAWSLDRRERRKGTGPAIPVKTCPGCMGVYSRLLGACPYCGHRPEPAARSAPEFVDGDLAELDLEALRGLATSVDRIDTPWADATAWMRAKDLPPLAVLGAAKAHRERQGAQLALRERIAQLGGIYGHLGISHSEGWKRFYFKFGVDVMSAQALGRPEAEQLGDQVLAEVTRIQQGGAL